MLRLMVIAGPDLGQTGEFDTETLALGRAPGSGFLLTDPRVSGRHGEITRVGGSYRYQDLGSRNGSQLLSPRLQGPRRIEGTVPLADGDAVALGPGTLVGVRTGVTVSAEVSAAPEMAHSITERLERDPAALLALYRFDRALSTATSLPELWASIRDGLANLFTGATRVVLLSPAEGDGWRLAAALDRRSGASPAEPETAVSPREVAFSRMMADEVSKARQARLYRDSFRELPLIAAGHAWPVFSTLCAPLLSGEELLGVVQVDRLATGSPFDVEDLELLIALAHRAATQVEAERLRSRREQSLLSQLNRALDRDASEWSLLISSLTEELGGSARRLLAAIDAAQAGARARIAGEREYFWDCLETLRANIAMARQVAFPLSHFLLERGRLGPQGGAPALEREPVDVAMLLHQLARTERPRAAREIEVKEAVLPTVMADRPRLFRALLNLLKNALDAQEEDGPQVEIRLLAEVMPTSDARFPRGRYLAIHVVDTGPGIPPDVLERIEAGDSITTRPQGAGMGIRIARAIVEAHGGDLLLRSEEGHGTTVTVRLPIE